MWEKDRKTFQRSKISAISNTPKGIVCIPVSYTHLVRPEIEPNYILEQEKQFEFCGYDLVDISCCISVITNCGAEFDSIDYTALNRYGLISSYREAVNTQLDLNERYPEDSHSYCEIVEIWRRLLK